MKLTGRKLKRVIKEEVKKLLYERKKFLTEGAWFSATQFPDMSKKELKKKWKERTKNAPEPETEYQKGLYNFSEINFANRSFSKQKDAQDLISNNTGKWSDSVLAVKVTKAQDEDTPGPDFTKEGPYWLVGTWIPE